MTRCVSTVAGLVLAVLLGVARDASATPFIVEYSGIIGSDWTSSLFDEGTTISGFFTYDTETPAIPGGLSVGFALIDYGFVIDFVDRADYVSTGIAHSSFGNITVPGSAGGRVDLLVQGVFLGPAISGTAVPTGSMFQIQDGSSISPANILVADTLPDTPFGLADVLTARIFLEWTNSLGGRILANFDLTSMTVGPQTTVPEPITLLLVGIGGAGAAIERARRRCRRR